MKIIKLIAEKGYQPWQIQAILQATRNWSVKELDNFLETYMDFDYTILMKCISDRNKEKGFIAIPANMPHSEVVRFFQDNILLTKDSLSEFDKWKDASLIMKNLTPEQAAEVINKLKEAKLISLDEGEIL